MKPNSILFYVLFFITTTLCTTAKAQVDANDSLALVDLYNSTNGPGWTHHENWLTTNPVNTWYGVFLTGTNVTGLDLGSNKLVGSLSASIGNLTQLQRLVLPYNQLSGALPAEIGNLVHLKSMLLQGNQLSGAIPAEIGNLADIQSLELTQNVLSGSIPQEIGNLTNLTDLQLDYNGLTGSIPAQIGNLTNLLTLNLAHNALSGSIPAEIGNLVNLFYLYLTNNGLRGSIPAELGDLVNISDLYLNHNQLTGALPASLHKLKKTAWVNLSYNQLSGFEAFNTAIPAKNIRGDINNNRFTFNGMQAFVNKFPKVTYAPQDTVLPIHQSGIVLWVSAGGAPGKNTYTWHRMGTTDSTVVHGDSTFTPTTIGQYYAYVKNAIAKKLTLYTDTIDITTNTFIANNRLNANTNKGEIKHMQVYPNPATNIIRLQIDGTATIVLTNSTGTTLLTKTINNNGEINVSKYANGTYYIQNKTTGKTQKIIIVH